ncbi:MAG: antibiotic biosynthesis monooxygenase [Azorhizobium sp. 32-67-21]|nr:MAG: antibiotic biosynthesis monooxygenase [Rhizobiales bacterium 12-68-15]OYX85332.1 MAG: antibiotic biosynthesis monooxygenase [Azorhizobium sp. 32-67-21]
MFIAMNRFKVKAGSEAEFERIWRERDSHLSTVPGFVAFDLLKGPAREDHVLYASHTLWASRADFEAWTKSEAFRAAHRDAGGSKVAYLGHPEFEGFESILSQKAA